ncbi:MAG TPA: hypothetical protein VHC00_03505 [Rhizobiaceae bacterium]|nr:hypothetical protein [Rhizobiaceae bacterium]
MFAKIALATAVSAGTLAFSAVASSAMPMASLSAPGAFSVQTIAWGCGVGWHPNPWGRCVPNRPVVYGYYWQRPVVVYRTYGWHRWRHHYYRHPEHWRRWDHWHH